MFYAFTQTKFNKITSPFLFLVILTLSLLFNKISRESSSVRPPGHAPACVTSSALHGQPASFREAEQQRAQTASEAAGYMRTSRLMTQARTLPAMSRCFLRRKPVSSRRRSLEEVIKLARESGRTVCRLKATRQQLCPTQLLVSAV